MVSSRVRRRSKRAFTLIEVSVTVCVLIIVLGLMVSLARYVRNQAAEQLSRDLLVKLDDLLKQYMARHDGTPPPVSAFPGEGDTRDGGVGRWGDGASKTGERGSVRAPSLPTSPSPHLPISSLPLPDEFFLRQAAWANNRDFVAALKADAGLSAQPFGPVAASIYDQVTLRDAWGREIVLMPKGDIRIGTAMQDRPFFFSAGPDGKYHTLEDNVYSYEMGGSAE